jgi:hypothetical protein
MYCPACGIDNKDDKDIRFCRACGRDLRAVSKVMSRSFPLRVAASLDAYFENRFQHNLRNGILNLIAFVALMVGGGGFLWHGAIGYGVFMFILAFISITTGIWDIWIYKRNLPRVAKQDPERLRSETTAAPPSELPKTSRSSITEETTRQLH